MALTIAFVIIDSERTFILSRKQNLHSVKENCYLLVLAMFYLQNFLNFDIDLKFISVSTKCMIKDKTEQKTEIIQKINKCYVMKCNEAVKCFLKLSFQM